MKRLRILLISLLLCAVASAYTVDGLEYTERETIYVQNANIDSALTDFPLLVLFADDLNIGAATNTDGFDVRFTANDGTTLLNFERIYHTVSEGSASGAYYVDTDLAASGDPATSIFLYHRAADTADAADASFWPAKSVWHMQEGAGTTVADSLGVNEGTETNGSWTTGPLGNALSFDGSTAYMEAGSGTGLDSDAKTVMCWVNPTAFSNYARVVAAPSEFTYDYQLVVYGGYLHFTRGGGSNNSKRSNDVVLTTGEWYHVAATDTGSAAGITLYVDGQAVASTIDVGDWSVASGNFSIGRRQDAGSYFNGVIDEVIVDDSAWSAAAIKFYVANTVNADHELNWNEAYTLPDCYVDPDDGNDDNDGDSILVPWKTIEWAEAHCANGKTVYCMDGTYPAVTINRAGNSGRASWSDAITFTPYSTDEPTIPNITISGDYDRYLVFDGVDINYPDSGQAIGTLQVLNIQGGGYFKFLNMDIHGALQRNGSNEYDDVNSTTNAITLGTYSAPSVGYVLFDKCDIGYTAQMAIDNQGPRSDAVIVQNCNIHDFGASGILHDRDNDDDSGSDCVYQNNSIYRQVYTWTAGHDGYHHGSGIHITGDDCQFLNNRIYLCGSSAGIRAYQGAVSGGLDGGVEVYGAYDDTDHTFDYGEKVTQETSGAEGKILRWTGSPATLMEIARATDGTSFDATHNIVSDANALRIWVPSSIGNERKWGGRTNVQIKNNLCYWGVNWVYKMELYDLAPGSQVVNNTIIGNYVAATGYNYFWYALHNITAYYYSGDAADLVFANNVFVGHVDSFEDGTTVVGNVMWGYKNGTNQTTLDGLHPDNKVYNWSAEDSSGHEVFDVSGNFFVGSADFDDYAVDQPTDAGDGFQVTGAGANLGDAFALVAAAFAVDFGDTTYYTTTDILGHSRGAAPDAGAYEYSAPTIHRILLKNLP